jgi:hypothetical protein
LIVWMSLRLLLYSVIVSVATRFLAIIDSAGNILHAKKPKAVNLPYGIAFNKAGDVYIANVGNAFGSPA